MSQRLPTIDSIRVTDQAITPDLALQIARQPATRVLLAETALPGALGRAIGHLQQAGVGGERWVVQTRRTGERLAVLAQVGVQHVEWTVSAPVPSHPGFAALREALDAAAALPVTVSLRWPVTGSNCRQLEELIYWWQQPHPALRAIVLEPELASDPPLLSEVETAWPQLPSSDAPLLVRSQRWPACLHAPAHAMEPASQRQLAADAPQVLEVCTQCSLQALKACAGVPKALANVLPHGWPGLRDHRDKPSQHTPQQRGGSVHFSPDCAEVRGLRAGLRQAWRLRLPLAAAPDFVAAAQADGWNVALSREPVHFRVGGHADLGADHNIEHLAMVGRDTELLQWLLADERALLDPPALAEPTDLAAQLERHRRLGRAYGFPPCCIEAFCDAFVETLIDPQVSDNAWFLWRASQRTQHFEPRLAVLNALLGQPCESPLRHLPCRFDCAASLALADQLGGGTAMVARPALVWRDGTFAWLDGRWDAKAQAVVDIGNAEPVGLTADSDALWHEVLAAVATCKQWPPATSERSDPFPLLLPFH